MLRLHIVVVLVFAASCGPSKTFGSLCKEGNAPAACGQVCDPLPGAPTSCPGGFYCAPNGTCDLQCTPTGGECGDGYACTADGRCVDDSGPGSNGPDADCPAVSFMATPTTPSIGLVLDQSGSMYPDPPGGSNGFAEMREALVGTSGVITQLEAKAYFGSLLYTCEDGVFGPGPYTEAVVGRALNNAGAVRASIDSKLSVVGGATPTHRAISSMVQKFQAQPPPAGSPPAIVLATDGLPNTCSNTGGGGENASLNAARAAYDAKIPVYVLAMNTNNDHFQDLANAGQGHQAGQPNVKYYLSNNAQELKAAFDAIISGVISCDLSLNKTIDAAQAMNGKVTVNGVELVYGTDWVLVNGNIIRLVGAACTNLKTTPNPMVNALFPCGAVIF